MKLVLVRHGESEHNIKEIMQGHIPSELTKNGITQAKKARDFLKNEKIDVIISSDLQRAKQTAEILNEAHKLNIIYTKILRERTFGVFEGKTKHVLLKAVKDSGLKYHEFTPEGGESCLEIRERMINFLDELLRDYYEKTVLLVTHGGNIIEFLVYLIKFSRKDYPKYIPDNCDITILNVEKDKKAELILLNNKDFNSFKMEMKTKIAEEFAKNKFIKLDVLERRFNYLHSKCMIKALEELGVKNKNILALAWVHDIGKIEDEKEHAKKGLKLLKGYFNLDEEEIDCVLNHGSSAQPKTEIGRMFRYADGLSMFYPEMKELFVESGEEEQLRKMFEKYKKAYADNKRVIEILERLYIS